MQFHKFYIIRIVWKNLSSETVKETSRNWQKVGTYFGSRNLQQLRKKPSFSFKTVQHANCEIGIIRHRVQYLFSWDYVEPRQRVGSYCAGLRLRLRRCPGDKQTLATTNGNEWTMLALALSHYTSFTGRILSKGLGITRRRNNGIVQ